MSTEEKSVLNKLLNVSDSEKAIKKLSKILLKGNGLFQKGLSYKELLIKIAIHNNIKLDENKKEVQIENELYLKLFQQEFEKLSEDEKKAIINSLEEKGLNKTQIASLTGMVAIGAAQVSGFGVYILATSTVGAITSVLGITLPFAFYTSMSTVISYFIGPVGFLFLGYALYKSFKSLKSINDVRNVLSKNYKAVRKFVSGDYERATLCFKYIASTRILVSKRQQNEIAGLNKSLRQNKKIISQNKDQVEQLKRIADQKELEIAVLKNEVSNLNHRNINLQTYTKKENQLNHLNSEFIMFLKNIQKEYLAEGFKLQIKQPI